MRRGACFLLDLVRIPTAEFTRFILYNYYINLYIPASCTHYKNFELKPKSITLVKMSAPNQGRQSPEPETQTDAQQQAHPGQPGSGKVSILCPKQDRLECLGLQLTDYVLYRSTTQRARTRVKTIRPRASPATLNILSRRMLMIAYRRRCRRKENSKTKTK